MFQPGKDMKIQSIITQQQIDDETNQVIEMVKNGWIEDEKLNSRMKKYKQKKQYLFILKECLSYQNRIIIPLNYRKEMLQEIHIGHKGITIGFI